MEEEIRNYLKKNLRVNADFEEELRTFNGLHKLVITLTLGREEINRTFVYVKTE